jgi:hypothetical protein
LPAVPWTRNSVTTILKNPALAGLSAYRGEVVADGAWVPVLARETWQAVEALLSDPARKPSRGTRSLLGGVAVCACGNPVIAGPSSRGDRAYRCNPQTRDGRPGPHVSVRAEPIDEHVIAAVVTTLAEPDLAGLVTPPPDTDTAALRREAAAIRGNLGELAADRALGLVSRAQLLAATERGNARLAAIGAELAASAGAGALAAFTRGEAAAQVWESLDLSRRREVIRAVGAVTLHPAGRGARTLDLDKVVEIGRAR